MTKKPIYPIIFLRTNKMKETREFYEEILKFPIALEQQRCIVYNVGEYGFWGFCETENEPKNPEEVVLTLVVDSEEDVIDWYNFLQIKDVRVKHPPKETPEYKIFNAFYIDPNGYLLEIQAFYEEGKPKGHEKF
ncbi:MAG: VOC family protein [Candidatus Heimdallarchaeota archaeon]|nr:VOC family protein [Candidatus Heimdallarchaeota archaeon]MCK4876560.1 VOC family protein [Candidatus Heimdallarchaeota archaeon]